ncbi:MAG: TonB-dependent receptor [Gammaproteobacteria bacterium]
MRGTRDRALPLLPAAGALLALAPACGTLARDLPTVTVTATREAVPLSAAVGNVAVVDPATLELIAPNHAAEVLHRVPGAWATRNSGQESLLAIRSPALTGPGACGAFLILQDGVPVRPAGFCNVNQLFDTQFEQAASVEVLRGPGSALYGSNALHGMVHVLMPGPEQTADRFTVESGPDGYARAGASLGHGNGAAGVRVTALGVRDRGWREDEGYDQYKATAAWAAGDGRWRGHVAATRLQQETAGYVTGYRVYEDDSARLINPNPEAYRDSDNLRAAATWRGRAGASGLEVTAFGRTSHMAFLQHFLPGQPLERNGQTSTGISLTARGDAAGGRLYYGADAEWVDGWLTQTQAGPTGGLPPALAGQRPEGRQYDYQVDAFMVAPWVHWERPLGAAWTAGIGLRAERMAYDYDNRMIDGNTADDGTPCPGGCLYSRPADRSDDFDNLAPKANLAWRVLPGQLAWLSLRRGFRAPQATELYRLQSGQSVAELDSETLDAAEIGWRGDGAVTSWELTGYWMEKDNFIFRDADGFNVSDGRSRHVGVELHLSADLGAGWRAGVDATWARHTWRFDRALGRGETIRAGDDMDSAPRHFGSARLAWDYSDAGTAELEWVHVGPYWLDAANTARYDGHDIFNLRLIQRLGSGWRLGIRLNNVADADFAERADYAFGDYRYLPGRERQVFVELAWETSAGGG